MATTFDAAQRNTLGEAGRRIKDLERRVKQLNQQAPFRQNSVIWYAIITKNLQDSKEDDDGDPNTEKVEMIGQYEMDEVLFDPDSTTKYTTKTSGRRWRKPPETVDDDSTADEIAAAEDERSTDLKPARELNSSPAIQVGTIVVVTIIREKTHALNNWVIIGTAEDSSGDSVLVRRSVVKTAFTKNRIQLDNDITEGGNNLPDFSAFLGTVDGGNKAYGGNEDGLDGVVRHFKWMWLLSSVEKGYFHPQVNRFKGSTEDEEGIEDINKMWIRFRHRKNGQVTEIYHDIINLAAFTDADNGGRFQKQVTGGAVFGKVFVAATSAGSPTIPMEFDRTGHLRRLEDTYSTEDNDPTDVNLSVSVGSAPSSGSLYNASVSQTTQVLTAAGADTALYNGGIGTLLWSGSAVNEPTRMGFVSSTGFGLAGIATTYNGAGTGGNNANIFWDLSKHLDGTDITLSALLVNDLLTTNKSGSDLMTGQESVELVVSIETTPVPDDTSFDVKVSLVYGPNATLGVAGARIARFDGTGEYEVVVYLFYDADKAAFDPDDEATYLLKNFNGVADKTTYSGNLVDFTFDFPTDKLGSNVCARAYLEFIASAADPQPLADQLGRCNITNDGDFAEECQAITGTAATATPVFDAETYSPDSVGAAITIDGAQLRNITPIKVVYSIDKGGNTTDFSAAGTTSKFQLFNPDGVEVDISDLGASTTEFNTIALTNPTNGVATDGFEITINYMRDSLIADGNQYIGKVTTVGITPTAANPATDDFYFNSDTAFPASDFFGDNTSDLPFPWSDFGGADTFQSTGTSGTDPYDLRFSEVQSLGSSAGTFTINGFGSLNIDVAGGALTLWQLESKSNDFDSDFSIIASVTFDTSLLVTANDSLNVGIQCDIGGSNVFGMLDFEKDESPELHFISSITGTSVSTSAGGLTTVTIEIRRTSDTVEVFFNDASHNSKSVSGVVNKFGPRCANVSGTNRDGNGTISTFVIQVGDHLSTLFDFYSPNKDRWNENASSTSGWQMVNLGANSLEQIIPASAGTDSIRCENLFAGGTNPNITASTWLVESNFTDMIFSGSATETAYIEVENVAVDTMQCGFRDNGTGGQKFFVNINAVDAFNESYVSSSAKVTIEHGEFTYDDFNGSDSTSTGTGGTGLFDIRWDEAISAGGSGTAVSSLSGDAYVATVNQASTTLSSLVTITSLAPTFLTSQSVEMSCDVTVLNDANNSGDHSNYGLMGFAVGGDNYHMYFINEVGGANPPTGTDTGGSWALITNYRPGGINNFVNEQSLTVGTKYNFKVTYDGSSTIKMFLDGSEVRTGSDSGAIDNMKIETRGQGTVSSMGVNYENFKLVVDGVTYVEDSVLFSVDDLLKHKFDDSSSPVTGIDIVTVTTLTTEFNCTYQDIDIQAPTGTQWTFDPSI